MKQNLLTERDPPEMLPDGRRGEEMGEKGEDSWEVRTASYRTSHGDVRYRIENTVNTIVITMNGDRWVLDLSW